MYANSDHSFLDLLSLSQTHAFSVLMENSPNVVIFRTLISVTMAFEHESRPFFWKPGPVFYRGINADKHPKPQNPWTPFRYRSYFRYVILIRWCMFFQRDTSDPHIGLPINSPPHISRNIEISENTSIYSYYNYTTIWVSFQPFWQKKSWKLKFSQSAYKNLSIRCLWGKSLLTLLPLYGIILYKIL